LKKEKIVPVVFSAPQNSNMMTNISLDILHVLNFEILLK